MRFLILALVGLLCVPIAAEACASVVSRDINGEGCIVSTYTVCCDGPGEGQVSCFVYAAPPECSPIITDGIQPLLPFFQFTSSASLLSN